MSIVSLLYWCQVKIRFLALWNKVLTKKIQEPINSKSYSLYLRISSPKRAGNNPKNLSLIRKKKKPNSICLFRTITRQQTKWQTSQNLKSAWIQKVIIIPQGFFSTSLFWREKPIWIPKDHWWTVITEGI